MNNREKNSAGWAVVVIILICLTMAMSGCEDEPAEANTEVVLGRTITGSDDGLVIANMGTSTSADAIYGPSESVDAIVKAAEFPIELEVGQVWQAKEWNPFRDRPMEKVLELRDGYVQYEVIAGFCKGVESSC